MTGRRETFHGHEENVWEWEWVEGTKRLGCLGVSGGLRLWMSGRTRIAETGRGREWREAGRWREERESGEGEMGMRRRTGGLQGYECVVRGEGYLGLAGTR